MIDFRYVIKGVWQKVISGYLTERYHNSETLVTKLLFPFLYFIVHWEFTSIDHTVVKKIQPFLLGTNLLSLLHIVKQELQHNKTCRRITSLAFWEFCGFCFIFFPANSKNFEILWKIVVSPPLHVSSLVLK